MHKNAYNTFVSKKLLKIDDVYGEHLFKQRHIKVNESLSINMLIFLTAYEYSQCKYMSTLRSTSKSRLLSRQQSLQDTKLWVPNFVSQITVDSTFCSEACEAINQNPIKGLYYLPFASFYKGPLMQKEPCHYGVPQGPILTACASVSSNDRNCHGFFFNIELHNQN